LNRPISGFTMAGLPLATPYSTPTPSHLEGRVAKGLTVESDRALSVITPKTATVTQFLAVGR